MRHNIPLNAVDFETLFAPTLEKGYTTYPFSEEFLKAQAEGKATVA